MKSACSVLLAVTEEAKLPFVFRSIYNKTIIRFSFCDIQNIEGLSKCCQPYQPQPSALADNSCMYLNLDYSGCYKTSSINCLKWHLAE